VAAKKTHKRARGKAKAKTKALSGSTTTRSTAGPGFDFEDHVAAWLLIKMLSGEPLPGVNSADGARLLTQTGALGWRLDDLLVVCTPKQGDQRQLAISCKSNVQVTASGLPRDFVAAAWQQWRASDAGPMRRGSDTLMLVTRGRHPTFEPLWADIKNWCDGDPALALARIQGTTKHRKVFESITSPISEMGATASDEEVIALIQHLQIKPLDFDLVASEDESRAITQCRGLLREGTVSAAIDLWKALVEWARDARLGNGTIDLPTFWGELRRRFGLKDHPDFSSSWETLNSITHAYKSRIEAALPSGFALIRESEMEKLGGLIAAEAVSVIYGESGSGKSALAKSVLDQIPDLRQVWLGPDGLKAALNEVERGKIGLDHPLGAVLKASAQPRNMLVIDAAERLSAEVAASAKALIAELIAANNGQEPSGWHVLVIGQTEAWADSRLQNLTGATPPNQPVGLVSTDEVVDCLRSCAALRWLASQDETVAALTNLRALAWVMQAESLFQAQDGDALQSYTAVADRLWQFWTGGRVTLQKLLMSLAEREASFEHSFALSELAAADVELFEARPAQLPLRLTSRNRIEFEHDLAADWARFQRLKEMADDTARWAAFATNPLWNGALRMLGQFLLREKAGSRSAWDVAFEALEGDGAATTLGSDVLLDALCLDPLAETFLNERVELLLAQNGTRLNRLLRRFQHVATAPGLPPGLLNANRSLGLYVEAHFRTPIVGRWPALAEFLSRHQERIAGLTIPIVSELCERWLTTLPVEIAPGVPLPFRKAFAEIALANARALQLAQGQGVIYIGDGKKPIYTAALAGAPDLPQEVSDWALEVARRRLPRKDVAEKIAEHRRKEAEKHATRFQTDATYRTRHERRFSAPTFISSTRKLPPWPIGAKGRVERDFRDCCTHSNGLSGLMKVLPDIAAEILLAMIVEDSPEESYSRELYYERGLGLDFDHEAYPTAYWKSQFFLFLQINPETALAALITLVNFCTDRWAYRGRGREAEEAPGIAFVLDDGTERRFVGNHRVFDWAQTNSNHTGQLHSALAALEKWLCLTVDKGIDVAPYIEIILRTSNSAGVIGVLVNVGKYRQDLFRGPLRPLLGVQAIYWWDDYRVDQAPPYQFDAFAWVRSGDTIFEMAKQWVFAPYRNVKLREIAVHLVATDSGVSDFLTGIIPKWHAPAEEKPALEHRILVAELDRKNYRTARDEASGQEIVQFSYPDDLQHDVLAFQRAKQPALQSLTLPYQCEKILVGEATLTEAQAAALAGALAPVPPAAAIDVDEATKRKADVAVASVLVAKAPEWLKNQPDVRAQAEEIIRTELAAIGETVETLHRLYTSGVGGNLGLVAHAVMADWVASRGLSNQAATAALRILTSGDREGVRTLMALAYKSRALLGAKWWRLLRLGVLRSALPILAPRYDEDGSLGTVWNSWLRRLRAWDLIEADETVESIDPLAIAHRVERLQRDRWRREFDRGNRRFNIPPEARRSSGLDTEFLKNIFIWLLEDAAVEPADAEQYRKLLAALWAFEAWRRYEDLDEDKRESPPSSLGYDILAALARSVMRAPASEGPALWEPVFRLGADAQYSVGHFISCWLVDSPKNTDLTTFSQHWRAMIQYALAAQNWGSSRQWFYGERLIRQLLGCGSESSLGGIPEIQAVVLQMRDLWETWARKHLARKEENVSAFCAFLSTPVGKPLRMDGLQWLLPAIQGEARAANWHRQETGSALTDFLNVTFSQDADKILGNAKARDALLILVAHVVARQVPAALALQERVRQIL
jgi:hypothetical protein